MFFEKVHFVAEDLFFLWCSITKCNCIVPFLLLLRRCPGCLKICWPVCPRYFDLSQYSVAVVAEYQKALKKGENGIDMGSYHVIFFVVLQQKQVSSKHRRVCQIYCFSTSALRQRSGDDLTSNGKSGGGDRGGNGGSKGSQLCCPKCGEPCTHVETFVCK